MADELTKKNEVNSKITAPIDRNKFISILGKVGTGVFASLIIPGVISKSITSAAQQQATYTNELPELPPLSENEDAIVRMMRDLKRALEKPVEKRKWSMVIDLRKCVGCHSCTVSCIAENKLPPGVVYRPVMTEEIGTYPNVAERYIPRPCMQCEDPPCVPVCPVDATWKREDGIVEIDYDQCIGCRYCITACPYSARTFDEGRLYNQDVKEQTAFVGEKAKSYELQPMYEYGKIWPRESDDSPIGNTRKCNFCIHRVEKGLLPECVVSCIGRATYFGDMNDPKSLVSELIASPNAMRLKEEMGTNPKVYYLM